MGWIAWILVGAVAGFLANKLMGGTEGVLMTIVLGIVGGLVGGYVAATVLNIGTVDGFNVESIVIATIGAVAVLAIVKMLGGTGGLRRTSR